MTRTLKHFIDQALFSDESTLEEYKGLGVTAASESSTKKKGGFLSIIFGGDKVDDSALA